MEILKPRPPARPAFIALAALSVLLVAATACAGSSNHTASATTTGARSAAPGTSAAPPKPAPPQQFSGSTDAFYVVPKPLRPEPPGTLIRVQSLGTTAGVATDRVMYHSIDADGHDRAVTGLISYPTAAPPAGGWPVVSWAHGTTGLASACAPSRAGGSAPSFGVDGVNVATDYIGMGPVGEILPYLSGPTEAHSVIDGVRAARNLAAAHAGTRWLAVGHSQGGQSALFTNQLAASYAPELHLLGTVSIAPAAVFTKTFGPNDQLIPRMVMLMGVFGIGTLYPKINLDNYLGPQVIKNKAAIYAPGCMTSIIDAFAGIPADQFFTHSPLTTEPLRSILLANDPGHVKAASPLLLVYGSADTWVVPARVKYLFHQLCTVGQVTQLVELPGATHPTEVAQGAPQIAAWLNARLAGEPVSNSCK